MARKYPGRTAKSFQFRAQNFPHVLALLGRPWLPGLVPARNVGTGVVERMERILADVEGRTPTHEAQFENQVRQLIAKNEMDRPSGSRAPGKATRTSTQFERDPAVKAWVLRQAKGRCEPCGSAAPFETADGVAFLEVHHVRHLADGGSDRPENAVALPKLPPCLSLCRRSRRMGRVGLPRGSAP